MDRQEALGMSEITPGLRDPTSTAIIRKVIHEVTETVNVCDPERGTLEDLLLHIFRGDDVKANKRALAQLLGESVDWPAYAAYEKEVASRGFDPVPRAELLSGRVHKLAYGAIRWHEMNLNLKFRPYGRLVVLDIPRTPPACRARNGHVALLSDAFWRDEVPCAWLECGCIVTPQRPQAK